MTDLRPSARAWVEFTMISAFVAVLAAQQLVSGQVGDWLALGLLLVCAAVGHIFPIRPAFDNVTYHLTSAFMIAGAMLLSPLQVGILASVALSVHPGPGHSGRCRGCPELTEAVAFSRDPLACGAFE